MVKQAPISTLAPFYISIVRPSKVNWGFAKLLMPRETAFHWPAPTPAVTKMLIKCQPTGVIDSVKAQAVSNDVRRKAQPVDWVNYSNQKLAAVKRVL